MRLWQKLATSLTGAAALGIATGCGDTSLKVTPPAIVNNGAPVKALPPLPASVVDAPIEYQVGPLMRALNSAVPRKFGDMKKRIKSTSNKRQEFAFEATRTPFKMSLQGENLTLSTVIEYQGRGWYNPLIGPTVSGGCGDGPIKPKIRVAVTSDLKLTSKWQFTPHTKVSTLEPATATTADQCRVTIFNVDVTDRVVGAVREQLESKLSSVDAGVARFDLHTKMEKWYNLVNKSVKITDSLYIVFNPGAVRFGGLRLSDSLLIADIRLFVQPAMISGPKPPERIAPLPALEPASSSVGDSARVMLEAAIGYDVASALLKKQLVGRTFTRYGRKVSIAYVRIYGLGDGRIALGVRFSGSVHGEGYLVGTPKFDVASNMLYVPDLDFDVATSNKLVQGIAWLKKGDVVSQLRELARFPLEEVLADTRAKVEQKINRELTDGVFLEATLHAGRVIDVAALERALVVRAEAVGTIALRLNKELPKINNQGK
ncbi:MAG: DUF4403 family protein [Gemmatimonadota bacterium]|nr:DUF4403 family protein [Gemmatimonadota bacterium]